MIIHRNGEQYEVVEVDAHGKRYLVTGRPDLAQCQMPKVEVWIDLKHYCRRDDRGDAFWVTRLGHWRALSNTPRSQEIAKIARLHRQG